MGLLAGKAIVITGAGRGIGAACAKAAALEGASVVVNDIDEAAARGVASDIVKAGGRAVHHQADISDWEAARDLIERCVAAYGGIDGLVNNAAILTYGSVMDLSPADVERAFKVNAFGVIYMTQHAVGRMAGRKGSIVNMTSGAHMGIPQQSLYGATKGAVSSFTHACAAELQGSGIRINCVSPLANTTMSDHIPELKAGKAAAAAAGSASPPPEKIVAPLIFLLSDLADKVHGQTIRIDRGRLNLVLPPTILGPGREAEDWTARDVAEAVGEMIGEHPLSPGFKVVELKSMTTRPFPDALSLTRATDEASPVPPP